MLAIVKSDRRASLTQQQEVSSNSLKRSETQQLVDYSVQQTAAVLSSINPEELSTEQRMELAKVTLNIASVMQQKQSLKHKQQALDQVSIHCLLASSLSVEISPLEAATTCRADAPRDS